ncbi:hypothetical protein SAMN02787118_103402 [Streptomyces mirabilis]|uniref:Uncharacterized protein n=2 Tax=Streptomyces mirabilis TaxID=68239 RepID=A0A1I2FF13_9ACTN|nr:hypothetical protein SAMN02787118_103402 [Streptomyces mirabilis]
MGKASRRRSKLRQPPSSEEEALRRERRRAVRAERRGGRRGSSLQEYENLASLGERHIREALIARHNRRMLNINNFPSSAVQPVLASLSSVGLMDVALRELGAKTDRFPAHYGSTWVDHLAWGVDSCFSAARLLFSGQAIGATVVLRSQFERWTENAAFNADVTHIEGESSADFAGRAWHECHKTYPFRMRRPADTTGSEGRGHSIEGDWDNEPHADGAMGPPVNIGEDHRVYPTQILNLMSEFLHGRGPWVDAVQWEAGGLLDGDSMSIAKAAECLADAVTLIVRQIRLCLATLAEESDRNLMPEFLFSLPERMPAGGVNPPLDYLIPLVPTTGLSSDVLAEMDRVLAVYEATMKGKRPAGRLFRDDELTHLHFGARRARAAKCAVKALEMERRDLGDKFNIDAVSGREMCYITAAEMAGLLSVWQGNTPAGRAAATCSSLMRSAYWLWLEDDDRALGALRCLLEQCARMKVWATKPEKAERLESSSSGTPKDWVNAAGWRRLTALNRALGEFAHAHAKIRWDGAREILWNIQRGGSGASIHTARGHALDALTSLLMVECIRSARVLSPAIGDAFEGIVNDLVGGPGKLESELEDFLNRTLSHKNHPLGDYSFQGPAASRR